MLERLKTMEPLDSTRRPIEPPWMAISAQASTNSAGHGSGPPRLLVSFPSAGARLRKHTKGEYRPREWAAASGARRHGAERAHLNEFVRRRGGNAGPKGFKYLPIRNATFVITSGIGRWSRRLSERGEALAHAPRGLNDHEKLASGERDSTGVVG
jgi:hypothetical protein